MVKIELSPLQQEALVDALNLGILEAINYLTQTHPELGDYLIRRLLAEGFKSVAFVEKESGYSLGVTSPKTPLK